MLINQSIKSKFDRTIGTGTTTVAYQPMYVYYDYGYFGNIYTPTELSVGLPVWITGIRIRMISNISYSSDNQTLKLGYCNKEEFDINVRNTFQQVPLTTGGFTSTGITNVKNNFNWAIVSSDENGRWIEINFDTPFNYDPTLGNLIVIWENRDGTYIGGTASAPASVCSTNGTFNSYYDYADGSMPSSDNAGTRASNGRPNIQLLISV